MNDSSLFFIQERVGQDGKIFRMYKFRTMRPGADKDQEKFWHLNEASGPVFKIKNDPRFTRIGKWLAQSGLDELPQIINILRGEMAMVGPRPLPPREECQIHSKWRNRRRSVKPGLTSSWVVKGTHRLTFQQWMKLDMEDIEEKSFIHDTLVVIKTVSILFTNLVSIIFRS